MVKKNIKETLLGTLIHGEETLNDIKVLRKVSQDKISSKCVFDKSLQIHRSELHLIVNEIIDTKKGAKRIRFVSEDGYLPPFEAGQYINIFVNINGVCTSRPYSISSSPKQKSYYEITVARIKDGFVSNYLLDNLNIGDKLTVNGPAGNFHYNPVFHKKKMLFLAGGSGITPFISMIKDITQSGDDKDILLIYGVRNRNNVLFQEELQFLEKSHDNFRYVIVCSDDQDFLGEQGFIDKELISRVAPDYLERTAYICGPGIMNEFCQKELLKLGLKRKDVRTEMFSVNKNITLEQGYPKNLKGDEIFKVKVRDRIIDAKANEPLLIALERAGLKVKVCCRSGECSYCRVKLISGNVYVGKGTLLREADIKFNYIHSCKSYPISDLEIEI